MLRNSGFVAGNKEGDVLKSVAFLVGFVGSLNENFDNVVVTEGTVDCDRI
jgi:hypothetical protein